MNVLYISYDGALDPLGSSQIIPYLISLSQKGARFTLLTYEKNERLKDLDSVNRLKERLAVQNIKWEAVRYHKSPTVAATTLDICAGMVKLLFIVLRDRVEIIHARSFVGAIPALLLAQFFKVKLIFDMRGFWADERVDGFIWKNKGMLYRIAKWWEKSFILKSDWIICLTEEAKKITEKFPYLMNKRISIDVIPTCADTVRFDIKNKNEDLLTRLNLQNKFIFIYFGSIGTWYLFDEMIEFFKTAKEINKNSFFLILTPNKDFAIRKLLENYVNSGDYFVDYVPYEQIPDWISIADVSLSFIKPSYSKKSSCPTKFAESLACGLPVIINSGIGDTENFVNNYKIGIVVEQFVKEEYIKAIGRLFKILDDKHNININCRKVAEDFFSLRSGAEKYWNIYQKINQI